MTDSAITPATYTITSGGPSWYNTGGTWSNRKTITIDHTKVSGSSSLTDFPLLISVTGDANLKTVVNGGSGGKLDGTDILFTASDGVTKLNHNGGDGRLGTGSQRKREHRHCHLCLLRECRGGGPAEQNRGMGRQLQSGQSSKRCGNAD